MTTDFKQSTVSKCKIVDIRKYSDNRGYLSVIENGIDIPLDIKRIYYLYMVSEAARGAHAHKHLQQFMIATSGSLNVTLDDGTDKKLLSWIVHGKDCSLFPDSGVHSTTSPAERSVWCLQAKNTKQKTTSATMMSS